MLRGKTAWNKFRKHLAGNKGLKTMVSKTIIQVIVSGRYFTW